MKRYDEILIGFPDGEFPEVMGDGYSEEDGCIMYVKKSELAAAQAEIIMLKERLFASSVDSNKWRGISDVHEIRNEKLKLALDVAVEGLQAVSNACDYPKTVVEVALDKIKQIRENK